ncbi:hypothetical protein N825_28480 [Skermanella stibiiresistens SB22]|uniref:Glycosyltransferase RgtA/B/C/D-like domain-containing protein n=1 Tax=Skermanella stibiiresistens SB22 TaxID=1385369 RepID=W9H9Z6_9PROT|nr:hypothetical protein [Skermanella stibiiresistens]EWY41537.1 hypothetical protein N825_28480 [Skermanella stibiiresistens SB22]
MPPSESPLTRLLRLDRTLARGPWARIAIIVLALLLTFAMAWLLAGKREVIAADTRDYLAFSPLRVFGYPAFLVMMQAIGDVRVTAVVVQTAIFLASSVFLALVVLRASRSLALTLALVVLLYANIVTTTYNFVAVTESLVTSSAMVALGALIEFYRTRKLSWFAVICVVAVVNIVIRPAGQVYLPFLLVVAVYAWLAMRVNPVRMLLAIVAAAVVSYGSINAVNYTVHGFTGTNSNHGTGLLGKAMLLAPKHAADFTGTPLEDSVTELAALMEPVVSRLDRMENERARVLVSQTYVNYLRFGVLFPTYRERFHHTDGWDRELYVRDIANAIVSKDWPGYLELSFREFMALVTLAPIMTSAEADAARADVERQAPWPYDGDERWEYEAGPRLLKMDVAISEDQRGTATVIGFRVVYFGFYVIGIGGALFMVVAMVRRRPASWEIQMIGSSAILYGGTITMTALGDVGGVRYLVPIWPCVALSWICAAGWIAERFREGATNGVTENTATTTPALGA